jgi:hypothetical protein
MISTIERKNVSEDPFEKGEEIGLSRRRVYMESIYLAHKGVLYTGVSNVAESAATLKRACDGVLTAQTEFIAAKHTLRLAHFALTVT